MPDTWKKSYAELREFVNNYPEIKLEPDRISIPVDVRPGFYQLFDKARESFIEDNLQDLLGASCLLSEYYLDVERELTKQLALDEIQLDEELQRFLHDPLRQLVRSLPDLLFDLLKQKFSYDRFYESSTRTVRQYFDSLNSSGYKRWIMLSILKLLKPDELLQIDAEKASFRDYVAASTYVLHKSSPLPKASKSVCDKYTPEVDLVVPDWIVHSKKINAYVSTISKLTRSYAVATDRRQQREWIRYVDVNILDENMSLLYLSARPEDISLVADHSYICRPDLLLIIRASDDWYDNNLQKIISTHGTLNPALGTYVISKQPIALIDSNLTNEGIHFLNIGFDQTRLEFIIETLAKHPVTASV